MRSEKSSSLDTNSVRPPPLEAIEVEVLTPMHPSDPLSCMHVPVVVLLT